MKKILLLHHPKISKSITFAEKWTRELQQLGASAQMISAWDDAEIRQGIPDCEIAITLGGDGTILRAARLCAFARAPILGVKMGRVGFLSEITPEQFDARSIIDKKYWIEERTMLSATCQRAGATLGTFEALNDVVVGRGKLARVVRLATFIEGDFLTTFVADGAIVASATGSTAYVFANGGPILAPDVKNLVIVPIAPYLSQIKSLVLPEGSRILFRLQTDHRAILTIDGQVDVDLEDGDEISVAASSAVARFVRFQPRTYFYRTLVERLRERSVESLAESNSSKKG